MFRNKAREFLRALGGRHNIHIITTSEQQGVTRLLEGLLGSGHDIRVIGGVRKYEVDLTWEKVPATYQPEGFPRPVQLRRRYYGESLPANVGGVVGDVYELDLALPEALRIRTILLLTNRTPPWERSYYKTHPRGSAAFDLGEIAHILS